MVERFGEFVRKRRLEAGYGLRRFAAEIGMQPSNLSAAERGKKKPPQNRPLLEAMARALGFEQGSQEWSRLFDLAKEAGQAPADVAAFAGRSELVPVLLRTVENRQLTDNELRELIEHINREF